MIRDLDIELQKKGVTNLIKLNIGDPAKYDLRMPPFLFEKAAEIARDEKLSAYAPSLGDPELKEFIAKKHGVSADEVFITHGLTEGIDFLFQATFDRNSKVLLQDPTYPLYVSKSEYYGAGTEFLNEDNLNEETFSKALNEKIAFAAIINPSNPTGSFIGKEKMKKFIEIAAQKNIPIILDGAYETLLYEEEPYDPVKLAGDLPVIYGGSMSKVFFNPGARVGYIVIKGKEYEEIRQAVTKLMSSRLSLNWQNQRLYLEALKLDYPKYFSEHVQKLKNRRDFTVKRMNEIPGISVKKPKGAFYAWANFDKKITDLEFIWGLIEQEKVFVIPGRAFSTQKNGFRMVFLPQEEILAKAFEGIERFVKNLKV
jgi:aspartate/methionine/tyrosine aminotransferase